MPLPGTLPQAGGTLQQAILNAQNEIARLLNSGVNENSLSVIQARQVLQQAQQAFQAATGSQQGIARSIGAGGGAAGLGGQAGFITPATFGNLAGAAGLVGAGGLLLGGSTPSQANVQQMQAQPLTPPGVTEFLQNLFGIGAQPGAQQVPGGGQMQPPAVGGLPGNAEPGGPIRFLPGQQQGSQAPGTPMDMSLPGGGTRPRSPRLPGPQKPRPTSTTPKPITRTRPTTGRR